MARAGKMLTRPRGLGAGGFLAGFCKGRDFFPGSVVTGQGTGVWN